VSASPWDEPQPDYSHNERFLAAIDADYAPNDDDDETDAGMVDLDEDAIPEDGAGLDEPDDALDQHPGPHPGAVEDPGATLEHSAVPAGIDAPDQVIAFDDPKTFDAAAAGAGPRFSKPVVIGFLSVVVLITIALAAAMIAMRPTATVDTGGIQAAPTRIAVAPAPAAAPRAVVTPDPGADAPIPYQASSPCPPGSTSAQNAASADPTRAWVCVRGGGDGQVLTLDLGKPMKVTAISITPGWVGTDNNGADQWLTHRVVTRVQWILINGADRTPVLQDTNNVHGEALQPMPSNGPDQGVLASQIQMIVLQTSRPPADTPTTTREPGAEPGTGGGFVDSVFGAPLGPAPYPPGGVGLAGPIGAAGSDTGDPVDNTFAVSAIKILGHPPQ
jgi:hypothetical protein